MLFEARIDINSVLPSVCCRLLQYNPLALVRSCAGSPEQAVNATATQPPHGLNDPQTAWDKAIVSTWNDGFNQTGVCRLNNYATTFQASVCDLEAHPLLTHLARVPTLRVGHTSPHKFELDAAIEVLARFMWVGGGCVSFGRPRKTRLQKHACSRFTHL